MSSFRKASLFPVFKPFVSIFMVLYIRYGNTCNHKKQMTNIRNVRFAYYFLSLKTLDL